MRRIIVAVCCLTVLACRRSGTVAPVPAAAPVTLGEISVIGNNDRYREAGFIVGNGSMPFVGKVGFAGSTTPDSTDIIVSISVPPRALSFVRAGDRYAAFYTVRLELSEGPRLVRSDRQTGEVRVASFLETSRSEEGIVYQRLMRIAPGDYRLTVATQDSLGNAAGRAEAEISVPRLADGRVAAPISIFTAQPRQSRADPIAIVMDPRSTLRYGRDSAVMLYVEAYGKDPDTLVARTSRGSRQLRSDTLILAGGTPVRSTELAVPIARLGFGVVVTSLVHVNGAMVGQSAAVITPGVDLPVETVADLLDEMRYFASEPELRTIRIASPEVQPVLWQGLVKRTDPNPSTPENEALVEYARRIRVATALFSDSAVQGWRTERGGVLAALGEPDAIRQSGGTDTTSSIRLITWDYRRLKLSLAFFDAGQGRWQLTPSSEAEFRSTVSLSGPCVGCR